MKQTRIRQPGSMSSTRSSTPCGSSRTRKSGETCRRSCATPTCWNGGRDSGGWRTEYQVQALALVQTRLSCYAAAKQARAILSQPRLTVDLRQTIHESGILLVSTAQGAVGLELRPSYRRQLPAVAEPSVEAYPDQGISTDQLMLSGRMISCEVRAALLDLERNEVAPQQSEAESHCRCELVQPSAQSHS